MNILLSGMCGFMGKEVVKLADNNYMNTTIVAGVDAFKKEEQSAPCYLSFDDAMGVDADCIVDFSHHSVTKSLLEYAISKNMPVVLCTTGHTPEEKELIFEAGKKIPVFFSANMSIGVALLVELAKKAASTMVDADIEIIEKHHNRKIDAPSGTALMIYDELKTVRQDAEAVLGRSGQSKRKPNDIGIHAVRMGNVVGEHEVILCTASQTITLKHEAHNRALFAEGALVASTFIVNQAPGVYNMKDMLK